MKNITYLFGAGASKNTIPIVRELETSMNDELKWLKAEFDSILEEVLKLNVNPHITKEVFKAFIEDFEFIIAHSKKHQSIDTFAKKLYIINDQINLKKLKTILSFYLVIIQSRKNADQRYDSFFASILQENHLAFPNNLRIISWNYDYQFEKAYSEYSRDPRTDACFSSLNIFSKNFRISSSFDTNKFGILKLNGTASSMLDVDNSNRYNYIETVNAEFDISLIHTILANYASLHHVSKTKSKLIPSLSFAWEEYTHGKPIVQKAIEFSKQTEILVVIGYSFPFFNRLVDRDIINAMANLNKVYFQAPDANVLKERFLAIRDNIKDENLIIRRDIDQFVFPNEF